jgi:hypothetical protein
LATKPISCGDDGIAVPKSKTPSKTTAVAIFMTAAVRSASNAATFRRGLRRYLEASSAGNNILLIDDSARREFEAVEPIHSLSVITVSPEGVGGIVGTNRNIGVVAEEPATETVPTVNGMGSD